MRDLNMTPPSSVLSPPMLPPADIPAWFIQFVKEPDRESAPRHVRIDCVAASVDWAKYSSAELDSYVGMLGQLFRHELVEILQSQKPNKCGAAIPCCLRSPPTDCSLQRSWSTADSRRAS